jgi:nucleoid-associated protein YgaU
MFVRGLIVVFLAMVLAWSVLARGSEGAREGERYTVRSGDTLWSIAAARYGGDPRAAVWELRRANGLGNATLAPGQQLVLP